MRRIRLDAGFTLREVAAGAAVSMPYLSEIERGRKEPSSEVLASICRALGLTLVDLLREVSDEALVVDLSERRAERREPDRHELGRQGVEQPGGVVRLAA